MNADGDSKNAEISGICADDGIVMVSYLWTVTSV